MEGRPYAFKSDVWALGCVMYEVLTGKPAFAAKNFPGVAMKVQILSPLGGSMRDGGGSPRSAVLCVLTSSPPAGPARPL